MSSINLWRIAALIIDPRHAWMNNAQPQISSCSDSKSSRGSGCRSVVTVVRVLGMGGTQGRGNLSHLRKSVKVFMGIQSESHFKGGWILAGNSSRNKAEQT